MTSQTTIYLSQLLGRKFVSPDGQSTGKIKDLLVDVAPVKDEPYRPRVIALKARFNDADRVYDLNSFDFTFSQGRIRIRCLDMEEISTYYMSGVMWLGDSILYKKIVDINGKSLVMVTDIRLVRIPSGLYALAVEAGASGIFRRLGILDRVERLLTLCRIDYPIHGKLILWDDLHALKNMPSLLQLPAAATKLKTLHPSDLADIIEDLDKNTRINLFSTLDEDQAADVLEEMEPDTQVELIESLPKEKMADVLEKMPADEAADILDELKDEKAEELLREMEKESSEDIRELLEYPDKSVGSIMTRDFMTFRNDMTVEETLKALREEKPEPSYIYSLYVVDRNDKFLSAIPLGELAVADPGLHLDHIMQKDPVIVYDDDDIDILAELVSKYNLLAVPVLNHGREMEGVVVVEDIVEDLLGKRKTQ